MCDEELDDVDRLSQGHAGELLEQWLQKIGQPLQRCDVGVPQGGVEAREQIEGGEGQPAGEGVQRHAES